jgi:nicotinamide-nucleotide amidase
MRGARVVSVGGVGLVAAPDPGLGAVLGALESCGVPLVSHTTVTDDESACEAAMAPGAGVALTIVVTAAGGTGGDIVRRVLSRASGARLVLNDQMLRALEERHRRLDRPVPRSAERQALLPQGAVVWAIAESDPAWMIAGDAGAFVVLPRDGDLRPVLEQHLVPLLQAHPLAAGAVHVRTLRTAGVSLGDVEERLGELRARPGPATDVVLTVIPVEGEVWVRLHSRGGTPEARAEWLALAEGQVAGALGDDCYGRDAESLEAVVGRRLADRGLTLSIAESCTGGLLGHRLTNVSGASAYFERGVIAYSNRAKQELLGVPESILRAHGAVSAPCAEAMAHGIAERAGSSCALAITGIAGPEGGTPTKPVGTVFIGLVVPGEVTSRRFRFAGGRDAVKRQSAVMALDLLRRRLTVGT